MARPGSRSTTLFIGLSLYALSFSSAPPPPSCHELLLDFEASALSGRARPFLLADDECGRSARALLPPAALAACLHEAHAGPAVRRRRFFDAVGEAAQRLLAHGERARDLGSGDESFIRTKTLVGAAWLLLRGSEGPPVSLVPTGYPAVATARARRRENARRTAAVVVAGHTMARLALAEGDYDGAERTMRDAAAAGVCAMRRRRQSRSGRGAAGRGRWSGSGEGETGGDRGGGDDNETGSAASEDVGGGKTTGDEGSVPQEIIRIIRKTCLHLDNDLLLLRRDYTGAFAHLRRWHARRRGVGGSGRRRRSRRRSSRRGSTGDGGGDLDKGEERADRQQQRQQQQQQQEEEAEVEREAENGDGRRAHNENSDDLISLNKLEHDVDQFNHLLSGKARDHSATGQAGGRGGVVGGAAVEHRLSAAVGAYGQLAAHIRSHPALQGLLGQGTAAKLSELLATIGHDDNASTTALGNVSTGTVAKQDTVGFSPVVSTGPSVSPSAAASAAAASDSAGASVSAAASAAADAPSPPPSRPSQGRLRDTKAIVHNLFNAAIHIPLPPTRPFRGRALGTTVTTAGEEARLAASMEGPSRVAVVDNFLR